MIFHCFISYVLSSFKIIYSISYCLILQLYDFNFKMTNNSIQYTKKMYIVYIQKMTNKFYIQKITNYITYNFCCTLFSLMGVLLSTCPLETLRLLTICHHNCYLKNTWHIAKSKKAMSFFLNLLSILKIKSMVKSIILFSFLIGISIVLLSSILF